MTPLGPNLSCESLVPLGSLQIVDIFLNQKKDGYIPPMEVGKPWSDTLQNPRVTGSPHFTLPGPLFLGWPSRQLTINQWFMRPSKLGSWQLGDFWQWKNDFGWPGPEMLWEKTCAYQPVWGHFFLQILWNTVDGRNSANQLRLAVDPLQGIIGYIQTVVVWDFWAINSIDIRNLGVRKKRDETRREVSVYSMSWLQVLRNTRRYTVVESYPSLGSVKTQSSWSYTTYYKTHTIPWAWYIYLHEWLIFME